MRASPQTPANGGQSLPQWVTPCYSSVGVEGVLWGGLFRFGMGVTVLGWLVCGAAAYAVKVLMPGGRLLWGAVTAVVFTLNICRPPSNPFLPLEKGRLGGVALLLDNVD